MKPSESDVDVEPAEWGELERALFRSGREEAPAATRNAVLGALGLSDGPGPDGGPDGGTKGRITRPSSPAPSGTAASAGVPARSSLGQWVIGGLLAAALPLAWLLSSGNQDAEPEPKSATPNSLEAQHAMDAAPQRAPAATIPGDAKPAEGPPPTRNEQSSPPETSVAALASATHTTAKSAANAQEAAPSPSGASTLAEELAMIRKARAALAAGRTAEALSTLDAYASRFDKPQLGHEAAMVRIEALVKSGRREEARRIAAPIIASGSVHAARARSLVEGPP